MCNLVTNGRNTATFEVNGPLAQGKSMSTETESESGEKARVDAEWKKRLNKAGDAYFSACRKIASALSRLASRREKKK